MCKLANIFLQMWSYCDNLQNLLCQGDYRMNLDHNLIMRKLSKSKKQVHNQLAPWAQPNHSNRSEFDQIHFRSISLLNPTSQVSTPHRLSQAPHSKNILNHSRLSADKDKKLSLGGKTLTTIKDYYKKHYTDEAEQFIENKVVNQRRIKQNNLKILVNLHKEISYKKTSIIDLTKSLNDNIKSNKPRIILQKDQNNREQTYNRILKIKQEMIRNKQRRKIDKKYLEINDDELRPQSKSVPLRVKSVKKNSIKTFFPDKSFGNLLSDFLQKV